MSASPDDKSYANQLKAAADAEDRTEKATVTPGPLAPARELSAAILLDHGMAREALAAYEDAMAKEPNRFHGLAGAATAAERLGDREKARAYFGKLVSLTSGSTGDRRELIAAKEFLARP
jgi:tetratricopeptide (TPR) repeat protein